MLAVGVLSGSKFIGGSLNGCRFFLFWFTGVVLFWSASEVEANAACFRVFGGLSFLTGSRTDVLPDKLFVDILLILLASKGKLDLRLKNGVSEGESFGDSYALGIAGTGGTSSSSLLPAELCKFRVFKVGNREDGGGCDIRGCREPEEV